MTGLSFTRQCSAISEMAYDADSKTEIAGVLVFSPYAKMYAFYRTVSPLSFREMIVPDIDTRQPMKVIPSLLPKRSNRSWKSRTSALRGLNIHLDELLQVDRMKRYSIFGHLLPHQTICRANTLFLFGLNFMVSFGILFTSFEDTHRKIWSTPVSHRLKPEART